jgi:hypothetical protein
MDKTIVKKQRLSLRSRPKSWTKCICRKGTLDMGRNIAVALLDVSETGLRLVVGEQLAVNQEVSIALETPSHARPLRITGKVVWCLPMADNNFCLGIRFNQCLAYLDISKLA